jgi:hypothetical protein
MKAKHITSVPLAARVPLRRTRINICLNTTMTTKAITTKSGFFFLDILLVPPPSIFGINFDLSTVNLEAALQCKRMLSFFETYL